MKFVLGKSPAVWWPVTLTMPDPENPGQTVKSVLKVLILPQGQDDYLAEQERIAEIKGARAHARAEREYLASRISGWDWPDMLGDDQKPVQFGPETVATAMQEAWFRQGLWRAIQEVSLGEAARLGN